jgi:hypothetical protein
MVLRGTKIDMQGFIPALYIRGAGSEGQTDDDDDDDDADRLRTTEH